MSYPVDLKTLC